MGWIILNPSVRGKRIRCTIVEMNPKIWKKLNKMFGNEFGFVPDSFFFEKNFLSFQVKRY